MTRYGGPGNRNPNRKAYDGFKRPNATRTIPDDFRERYLEMGWEAQWYYSCNWRVMCRWIDEARGQDLIDARAQWLRDNGRNMPNRVTHTRGWNAKRIEVFQRSGA